jgi:cell division protease FtsH
MGGRAAEELFIGQIATGALNDLERATKIAQSLVVYYGMSEKLPNVSYYDSTGSEYGFSKPYSEERSRIIDEEVSRVLNEQYARAKDILMHYKDGHAQLTQELFDREVIFTADVEAIFGKRQWVSRADEILALNEHKDSDEHKDDANSEANKEEKAADAATNDNNDNTQTNG